MDDTLTWILSIEIDSEGCVLYFRNRLKLITRCSGVLYILHNKKDNQNNFKSVTVPKSMDRGLTWPKVSGMRRGEGSLYACTTGKIQIDTGRKCEKKIEVDEFQAQECEEVWAPMYNGDGRDSIPKAHHEHMLK